MPRVWEGGTHTGNLPKKTSGDHKEVALKKSWHVMGYTTTVEGKGTWPFNAHRMLFTEAGSLEEQLPYIGGKFLQALGQAFAVHIICRCHRNQQGSLHSSLRGLYLVNENWKSDRQYESTVRKVNDLLETCTAGGDVCYPCEHAEYFSQSKHHDQ